MISMHGDDGLLGDGGALKCEQERREGAMERWGG